MTTDERKILANQPITWTGDLSDDCTTTWAGLMLRAEWMDEDYWWWAVYDMQKGSATIDSSNNYSDRFVGGDVARQKTESIAQKYITEITTWQETAKYLIADAFKITGRGLVLAGYIKKGTVSIGDTIEFAVSGILFQKRIIGVEGIRKSPPDKIHAGLFIKCDSEAEMDELSNSKPKNVVAIIYKTDMNGNNPPAPNSVLPKAKRTWLQRLFGSE